MKNKFFQIIGLITIIAFVALACGSDKDDTLLKDDIAQELYGTWQGTDTNGATATVIFSKDGISFSGTGLANMNKYVEQLQEDGYTVVCIAKEGEISLKYSGNNEPEETKQFFTYTINGNELNIYNLGSSIPLLTMTKVGPPPGSGNEPGGNEPIGGGALTPDIADELIGEWTDINTNGATL
ncbi:MAG: hypothetical protein FWH53_02210, partial [Leptospirales bacterium]|nr:hypothetical protein [Leptospirales bacterium]